MTNSNQDITRQKLRELRKEKGIASRAIGEAKQQNRPTDALIREVQGITRQIKELENTLSQSRAAPGEDHQTRNSHLPPQFRQVEYTKTAKPDSGLETFTDIDSTVWDDYVDRHPNATVYHTSQIRTVIEKSFAHPCHYLAVMNESRQVRGVLPLVEMKSILFGHFLVSLPFFNYGGLLASSVDAEDQLTQAAAELATKLGVNHVEYRDCWPGGDLPARTDKIAMIRALPDSTEQLWHDLGTKVRAQVKRSDRFDPNIQIGREDLVDDFYAVFSRNMRDLGTPVYGRNFFTNMISNNPDTTIVIVRINEKPVSAAFLIGWRNSMEIPWASTIRSANRYDANMRLYWEVLKLAVKKEYQVFDFGRSSREGNTSRFKRQWGASEKPLYWHYWLKNNQEIPLINQSNRKFALLSTAWKYLPLRVSNSLGPSIVKYVP